jgi:coenzyme PQQ synthesis protein D (PqqD)
MKGVVVQSVNPARSFVTRRLAGETLIVPVAGGVADLECIYVLNAVAARIWDLLATPMTPDAVAAAISSEFEVSPDESARDVAEFLDSLRSRGMIDELEEAR